MANENDGEHRTRPVRVVHLSIADAPARLKDAPLVIMAKLDPGPDQGREVQWWTERLRERVNFRGWSGVNGRLTSVQVEAPSDQVEEVARRLLTAIDDANAAFPERYPVWLREHEEQEAEERLREQRLFDAQQTILDRVMEEYQSTGEDLGGRAFSGNAAGCAGDAPGR
jgi:hypothetical protein